MATGTRDGSVTRTKIKNPCGQCKDECKAGNSVSCGFCETYYHAKCVDGMTPEFVDSCDKITKLFGGSAFLCFICRKLAAKINKSVREVELKMAAMESDLKKEVAERKALEAKVERMESRSDQVKEKVVGMEKEIEAGMERTKKEVRDEMETERKEREERSENVVVYGMKESEEEDAERRKEYDKTKFMEMAREIDVEVEEAEIKFRAGKKREDGKPRPMIVKVKDDETKQRLLTNARKLARKEEWKAVYVSPDLTWQQREEARKEEKKLREEVERLNKEQESKNDGRRGTHVIIGPKGRRRIVWREERRE